VNHRLNIYEGSPRHIQYVQYNRLVIYSGIKSTV